MLYDVIIIGAGIIGCAAARALSRYNLRILVAEREPDVACGASRANSGIVHAGYDCEPGTRKAALNVKGAAAYPALARELDIPYRNNGSLVLCLRDEDMPRLRRLYEYGRTNGVPGLSLLTGEEALKREPNLNRGVIAALLAESAGVVSPYEATVAFAENAAQNGVEFITGTEVTGVRHNDTTEGVRYTLATSRGVFTTRAVINAAGLNSGTIHNMVCKTKEAVLPQRGQYYLLDNNQRDLVRHTLFQLPTPLGKGVLVTPTADYNILIGPNAEDGESTIETTRAGLDEVLQKAAYSLAAVPVRERITAFAGIRAKHESKDFIIDEPLPGFFDAIGIDSPGLSAAPAIAQEIADSAANYLQPAMNPHFNARREGITRFNTLPFEQQAELINQNALYGRVVCRCETVTEAEIVEAIRRPVGARDLDGVKRRTRAQMGRCQGGFCTLRITEILSRELGIPETEITKNGHNASRLLL